jgi:hypothetical protein
VGWYRDAEYERSRQHPVRPLRSYLFDQQRDASVRLLLELATPTRVHAGAVQLLRCPPGDRSGRTAEIVADFAKNQVLPAAAAASVTYSSPSFGPRSTLTPAVETQFTRLADEADGDWPLKQEAQNTWDELVSCCLSEHAAIDRSELTKWLTESGWSEEAAQEMTDRFFQDSNWLAARLAVAAQ